MTAKGWGRDCVRYLPGREEAERTFAALSPAAKALEESVVAQGGIRGHCAGCGFEGWLTQPPTPAGEWANLREGLVCACGLNSRMRQILVTLDALLAQDPSLRRAVVFEQVTPLYPRLRERLPALIGSEFLDPALSSGQIVEIMGRPVRHESLQETSYAAGSLDLVMHFDVLEHVPDAAQALAECHRILRPGGWLFFTCPFYEGLERTIVRARMVDGAIEHRLQPCYHSNPVDRAGALVYIQPGWDLLAQIASAGFPSVAMLLCFDPGQGILTNACPYADGHTWPIVFAARKPDAGDAAGLRA